MKRALATSLVLLTALAAAAGTGGDEGPLVKATVEPGQATVGDVLSYRVNIAGKGLGAIGIVPPEQREYFPPVKKEEKKTGGDDAEDPAQYVPLYVIHTIKKYDRSDKTMTDITVTVQISFYRPGKYALPEIDIKGSDGVAIGYKIPEIEVKAVNEKGELQEIEQPLDLGGNYTRLIILCVATTVAAVAGFFLYRYLKKLYDQKKAAPVIIPPIEIFMEEIYQLGGDRLIEEGRIEEFVFGISLIFRKFLSLQFRFDAAEMTSYEIEKKIRKIFPGSLQFRYSDTIMESLNLWDLSKFAEFAPSKEILRGNLERIIALAKNIHEDMSNVAPRV